MSLVTIFVPKYSVALTPSIGLGLQFGALHLCMHSFAARSHTMFNLTGNGLSSNGVSSTSSWCDFTHSNVTFVKSLSSLNMAAII